MAANKKAAPSSQPGTALKNTSCTANTTPCTTALEAVVEQFRDAMRSHGTATDDRIVADGALHRVHVEGDWRGTRNGWYVLHLDGIPAGAFGHWKAGSCSTWRADIGRKLARAEVVAHRARMNAALAQRDANLAQQRTVCRERAAKLWQAAGEARSDHPYPSARIVIAADHDSGTPDNPGHAKGTAAARAVGGTLAVPAFASGDSGTDWNDYGQRYGMAATAEALLSVVQGVRHAI